MIEKVKCQKLQYAFWGANVYFEHSIAIELHSAYMYIVYAIMNVKLKLDC